MENSWGRIEFCYCLFAQLTQRRQGLLELLEEGLRAPRSPETVLSPIADRLFRCLCGQLRSFLVT